MTSVYIFKDKDGVGLTFGDVLKLELTNDAFDSLIDSFKKIQEYRLQFIDDNTEMLVDLDLSDE